MIGFENNLTFIGPVMSFICIGTPLLQEKNDSVFLKVRIVRNVKNHQPLRCVN